MQNRKTTVLMCLSGLDSVDFIERAAPHVPLDRSLVLLYVVDTRPAQEIGYIARRMHGGVRGQAGREAIMEAADDDAGNAILLEAEALCTRIGYSPASIMRQIRRGRPEQEIIATASQPDLGIGLVVIGSSYKRGPHPLTGPASVGHVARFVVDHSPCDVLLLR